VWRVQTSDLALLTGSRSVVPIAAATGAITARNGLSKGCWLLMVSGGARNRSGPKPQEGSGRSDRRGYRLSALPAEGFPGDAPDFPLPSPSDRELEVWAEAWRTPQACAWSLPSEAWRIPSVAMWVRVKVRCEDPRVGAVMLGQLHRFADQIGLTTAGLAEMGWKIAEAEGPPTVEAPSRPAVVRRLRVAGDAK
jgi:hypothetical protein